MTLAVHKGFVKTAVYNNDRASSERRESLYRLVIGPTWRRDPGRAGPGVALILIIYNLNLTPVTLPNLT